MQFINPEGVVDVGRRIGKLDSVLSCIHHEEQFMHPLIPKVHRFALQFGLNWYFCYPAR